LLGVQEVPGSNPGGPTKIPQRLTASTPAENGVLESNWSPKWTPGARSIGSEPMDGI
jgi:hypothetical protein